MRYRLDGEFRALMEKEGTLYAAEGGVEVAAGAGTPERGTGILLRMGERAQFQTAQTLYARSAGASAVLNVQDVKLL